MFLDDMSRMDLYRTGLVHLTMPLFVLKIAFICRKKTFNCLILRPLWFIATKEVNN